MSVRMEFGARCLLSFEFEFEEWVSVCRWTGERESMCVLVRGLLEHWLLLGMCICGGIYVQYVAG